MKKHQVENQTEWLSLYIRQPLKSKIRKLYMNSDEVVNYLHQNNASFLSYDKKDNCDILNYNMNKKDIVIYVQKSLLVIDGMNVILTKKQCL